MSGTKRKQGIQIDVTTLGRVLAVSVLAAIPTETLAQADLQAQTDLQANAEVHVYIGYVAEAFADTPIGQGLLPTAVAEADIALEHARLALEDSLSLVGMRRHAGHVVHALDPTVVGGVGPGLGYGVRRAAEEAARQIELAAAANAVAADAAAASDSVDANPADVDGPPRVAADNAAVDSAPGAAGAGSATPGPVADPAAPERLTTDSARADSMATDRQTLDTRSENVARHAPHITSSLTNAVRWTGQAIELAQDIQTTPSVTAALPLVVRLFALCHAIRWGRDVDGDGIVGWRDGEGGLAQASYHLSSLRRGEGLAY